jgi:hypothetical protein
MVAYVRRQDYYLQAAWQQWYFKLGQPFDKWLDEALSKMANWHKLLCNWRNASFAKELIVRRFEKNELVEGNVVKDFFKIINYDAGEIVGYDNVNKSLNEYAMMLAEKNVDLFDGPHDNRFFDMLSRYGGKELFEKVDGVEFINLQVREKILKHYEKSNELLAKEFFNDGKPAFRIELPKTTKPPSKHELREKEIKIMWKILSGMCLDRHGKSAFNSELAKATKPPSEHEFREEEIKNMWKNLFRMYLDKH